MQLISIALVEAISIGLSDLSLRFIAFIALRFAADYAVIISVFQT
jgi:hypothetical protein